MAIRIGDEIYNVTNCYTISAGALLPPSIIGYRVTDTKRNWAGVEAGAVIFGKTGGYSSGLQLSDPRVFVSLETATAYAEAAIDQKIAYLESIIAELEAAKAQLQKIGG